MELGWVEIDGNDSGSFTDTVHKKLAVHFTQGTTVAGAVSSYKKHNSWPHATVRAETQQRVQHNSLKVASRALKNEAGGIQTNRDGVINLEIVGFSEKASAVPDYQLKWLGEQVFRPIMVAAGIPNILTKKGFPLNSTEGYGQKTKYRMSFVEWDNFSGVCGHCNVPENYHWDPGALNLVRILWFAFPPAIKPSKEYEELLLEWSNEVRKCYQELPTNNKRDPLVEDRAGLGYWAVNIASREHAGDFAGAMDFYLIMSEALLNS